MIDFVLNKTLEKYAKDFGFDKIYTVDIVKDVRKAKGFIVVEGNYKKNLEILKNKKVNILLNPEKGSKKDHLHYRNSGLNQVLCKLVAKNKIAIGISFREILESKDREKLIGRIMQNVKLCKKYKVKIIMGSFATNKYELRGAKDLEAFGRILGIDKLDNENIFKYKEFTDIEIIK